MLSFRFYKFAITLFEQEFIYEWLIDSLLFFLFIILVRRVFAPENRERFRQGSLIPLEDDTDEEKRLFR